MRCARALALVAALAWPAGRGSAEEARRAAEHRLQAGGSLKVRSGDLVAARVPAHAEVGPVTVEGAAPGDTLVVQVLKLRVAATEAVSGEARWSFDHAQAEAALHLPFGGSRVALPLRPALARAGGVGPVGEGTVLELPVRSAGAPFSLGAGLARPGLAAEVEATLRFDLRKGVATPWPHLEDAAALTVVGISAGGARRELARWIAAAHGLQPLDAEWLVAQAATVEGTRASLSRSALPVRGTPGQRLALLDWTAAEKLLGRERVVVLPLGAGSKEHGPHLTLGNDEIIAEYLAGRLLAARPIALLPTLTYGFYPAFLEYPGSVSLSSATQDDVVAEIVRSIARYGPRRFYVLNTGVSTARSLQKTVQRLAAEGVLLGFSDVKLIGKAAEDRVKQEKYGTHADEVETSMILYMRPGAVRMDRAVADGARTSAGPLTRDERNEAGHYSPSGVFGDATLASWTKGEAIVEQMVADILAEVDALARAPLPAGEPRSPLARDVASP